MSYGSIMYRLKLTLMQMMMTKTSTLMYASLFAMLASSPALASDIYKYTDENGIVHYVDRPTGAPTEQRVNVSSKPSDASPSRSGSSDRADWRERRAARQEARESAQAERDEREKKAELCQQYRDRLQQYDDAPRLFRMDEQGERYYLEPEEVEEARSKVLEAIEENCNG